MPGLALAYMGPGAGLAAIGSLLVLIAAVLLTLVGFVWFPLQRLIDKIKSRRAEPAETQPENKGEASS